MPLIAVATILYCAWYAKSMFTAWQTSPLDQYGWVVFALWLIPAVRWSSALSKMQEISLRVAIAITFLGTLAGANTIKWVGLAVAVGSLIPWSWRTMVWVFCAVSWMPTFGWPLVHLFPYASNLNLFFIRFALAFFGVAMVWSRHDEQNK